MEAERRTPDRDVLGILSRWPGQQRMAGAGLGHYRHRDAPADRSRPCRRERRHAERIRLRPGSDPRRRLLGRAGPRRHGRRAYPVEGRFADCPFGRRLSEIRVRFLDDGGNWLGGDGEKS